MFDKFTDRSRKVMGLAWNRAKSLNHPAVGTEHLLLALYEEGQAVAYCALKDLYVESFTLVDVVMEVSPPGESSIEGQLPLTDSAFQALKFAVDEAGKLGHSYVGTEHILLGLVRTDGAGMAALRKLAVTPEMVVASTYYLLGVKPK